MSDSSTPEIKNRTTTNNSFNKTFHFSNNNFQDYTISRASSKSANDDYNEENFIINAHRPFTTGTMK